MNCHYCKGIDTYQEIKTQYFSSSTDNSLFVENFPVLECIQCGEQIISDESMNALDLIHNNSNPVSFKNVPVYNYDDFK